MEPRYGYFEYDSELRRDEDDYDSSEEHIRTDHAQVGDGTQYYLGSASVVLGLEDMSLQFVKTTIAHVSESERLSDKLTYEMVSQPWKSEIGKSQTDHSAEHANYTLMRTLQELSKLSVVNLLSAFINQYEPPIASTLGCGPRQNQLSDAEHQVNGKISVNYLKGNWGKLYLALIKKYQDEFFDLKEEDEEHDTAMIDMDKIESCTMAGLGGRM
ncbi:hypothetical protein C8J56DRAFT_902563 [Mycena floridula]|nr:hypothetical protein C8J56DRAFT_902563 [Mycena floridula]